MRPTGRQGEHNGNTIALNGFEFIWSEAEDKLESGRRVRKPRLNEDGFALETEETMPDLSWEEQADLLAKFLARKWPAENEVFEKLRPYLRQDTRRNFPSLWEQSSDLQQEAFLKLCQMRDDPKERHRIQPTFTELARYLINAPARVMMRSKRKRGISVGLQEWHGTAGANQTTSTYLKELMHLTTELPEALARTLLLQSAHELGEGPALHVALGITQDAAQRKLVEAQDELLTLSRGEVTND